MKIHQAGQDTIILLNHYERFARGNELPAATGKSSSGSSVGVASNCLLLMQSIYTIYIVCTYKYIYIYVNVHTYIHTEEGA